LKPAQAAILALASALLLSAAPAPASEGGERGRVFTLDETMEILGAAAGSQGAFRWDPFFREGSFAVRGHHGIFPAAMSPGETGFLIVNNRDLHQVPLPYFLDGELVFPEGFVSLAHEAFARASRDGGSFHYRIAAIVIDPGHGGRDPGAVFHHTVGGASQTVRESDIALAASAMLRDMLSARFPDKRVLMTRETDITLSLEDRTLFANSVPTREDEGIIFVSIHANYATNRNARGFEVWHLTRSYRRELDLVDASRFPDPELRQILNLLTADWFHTESIMLAQSILDGMHSAMGGSMPNRGLRAEDWFVVRRSNMPAVLVELGFVTNRYDAMLMTDGESLRRMVEGVYRGIADFVDAFERSGGFIIAQ